MSKKKKAYRTSVYDRNTGKRISVYAKSQRELDEKVLCLKKQIADKKDLESNRTFGYWAEKWMVEQKIPSGICSGTLTQYKSAITHLNNEFKDEDLTKIRLTDFQRFINSLADENPNTEKPTSKRTLESICKVAHAIFMYANANAVPGITDFFPSVKINKNAPVKKRESLSAEQINMIVSTEFELKPMVMIMLFCGLRKGEVIPLTWNDIDFKNHTINMNKSVIYDDNQPRVKMGGKTNAATRVVPMPKILEEYLQSYKGSSLTNVLVCPNNQGRMHTKTTYRDAWESFILTLNAKYGYYNIDTIDEKSKTLPLKIDRFTAHYLRHTYATMLYLQGVDVVTAKRLLGHANIQVTIDIYTDLKKYQYNLPEEFKRKLLTEYKVPVSFAS